MSREPFLFTLRPLPRASSTARAPGRLRLLRAVFVASALQASACASSALDADASESGLADASTVDTGQADAPPVTGSTRVRDARAGVWFTPSGARNGGASALIVEAQARFTEWQRPNSACSTATQGACTLEDCHYNADASGAPLSQRFVYAGTITYTLPRRTANPMFPANITIEPDAVDGYTLGTSVFSGGTGWAVNEPVEVVAEGGTIPPFSATVGAPPNAQLGAPQIQRFTEGATTTFSKGAALALEWRPDSGAGAENFARFAVRQTTPVSGTRAHVVSIECKFPLTAGTAEIPASMMTALEDSAESKTTFRFSAYASTLVNAGTTRVTVEAFGGGEYATATVTP